MKAITHLPKSKRGISTVVGAALVILILITFFTGVYFWTAVTQQSMNQLDWDRKQEKIEVYATFGLIHQTTTVNLKVKNIGVIDVKIVRIWLTITNSSHISHTLSPPKNVPKGSEVEFDVKDFTASVDVVDRSSFNYQFRVITERGNIATTTLVSELLKETNQPLVIIPGSKDEPLSYVNTNGEIHLVVWNSLDENQRLSSVIATGIDIYGILGPYKREIIFVRNASSIEGIICPTGRIKHLPTQGKEFKLQMELNRGETVIIELINTRGFVVCSHYFIVES